MQVKKKQKEVKMINTNVSIQNGLSFRVLTDDQI